MHVPMAAAQAKKTLRINCLTAVDKTAAGKTVEKARL